MKIYAISGLGADERVFSHLHLDFPLHCIKWVLPQPKDNLEDYANKLLEQIDLDDDVVLIGVSFGGMIAIALQPVIKPILTILISSAQNKYELPFLYRFIGKTGILKVIPSSWIQAPKTFLRRLFGAQDKKLLYEIVDDTPPSFLKWALQAIATWKEEKKYANVIKIHGTKDKLIPYFPGEQTISIKEGEHFMIVDCATEISDLINQKLNSLLV